MATEDAASPRKYTVTITYTHPGTQPPIYVAGTFTTPEWDPHELHHTAIKNEGKGIQGREYNFHREFEVEEGHWQYKLRAGLGDWWMLDEQTATVTDDAGNRNNLLVVGPGTHNVAPYSKTSKNITTGEGDNDSEHILSKKDHTDGNMDSPCPSIVEEIPIPITVVEQVPDQEPPVYGDIDRESLHEDNDARQADAEPDELVVSSAPKEASSDTGPPFGIPIIVVEKTDTSPRHGEDMGSTATHGQMIAHAQRAMDAEPDSIIVAPQVESADGLGEPESIGTPISEVATAAAEVADSAALLDASPRSHKYVDQHPDAHGEPSIYTIETGPGATEGADTGAVVDKPVCMDRGSKNKHLSCMSEIANTAAEVADSAAAIDSCRSDDDDLATFASAVGYGQSDTESPRLEYAPLLPHERVSAIAPQVSSEKPISYGSSLREVQGSEDLDDPSLEPFPTDYNGIVDQIRSTESHLDEDMVSDSPSKCRPRPLLRGQVSPNAVFDDGQSPVLLSISESSEEDVIQFPGVSPMSLPEGNSKIASQPSYDNEYFVGDEASLTSSRSSRCSTINSVPQGRNLIGLNPILHADTGSGVEAIIQAHTLSLRNGKSAESADNNFALDGATEANNKALAVFPNAKPMSERTIIDTQELPACLTPRSRSSDGRQGLTEHDESHNPSSTSVATFEGTNESNRMTIANEQLDNGLRHRKSIVQHDVKRLTASTTSENTSSDHDSQNLFMTVWKALAGWIAGLFARLRG